MATTSDFKNGLILNHKNSLWKIIEFLPDTTWSSWNPGHFPGLEYGDDLWGYPSFESPKLYESFTDLNINGICDYDEHSGDYEPFFDEDASDTGVLGKCDEDDDWTSRCPIENKNCLNVVVVEPGYKASNYTEPSYYPKIEFIIPDSNLASPFTNKTILN